MFYLSCTSCDRVSFTGIQVKLSEKTSLQEMAEGRIVERTEKVNEQQKLIQKLEDDILKVWINFFWHSENGNFDQLHYVLTAFSLNDLHICEFSYPVKD